MNDYNEEGWESDKEGTMWDFFFINFLFLLKLKLIFVFIISLFNWDYFFIKIFFPF